MVGLEVKRDAFPAQLLGSQKQQVGIVRALASAPPLLLCAEATSTLNSVATAEILALIRSLRDRPTSRCCSSP